MTFYHLDFDVRVRAVDRGRQTWRRTVSAQSGDGRRLTGHGHGRDFGDVVVAVLAAAD